MGSRSFLSRQKDKKGQDAVNYWQSCLELASKWSMGGLNYSLDSPKSEKENPKSMTKHLAFLLAFVFLVLPWEVSSHRSDCHRWHSCPSDRGTYVCGDQGYCTQCTDNQYCLNRNSSSGLVPGMQIDLLHYSLRRHELL